MSMAQATAAPAEIRLGSQIYRMTPFNFRTMGEYLRWVQDAYLADAKRLSSVMDDDERKAFMREAVKTAERLSMFEMDNPIVQRFGTSPDGVIRLMYYSIRPNHPEITIETVAGLLDDMDKLQEAFDQWGRLNQPPTSPDSGEKKGAQNQPIRLSE